ncbi:MAG: hypothetical protein AAGF94_05195 [Pseudomonadota bacterium]
MAHVIETVRFELRDGIEEAAFLTLVKDMEPWLAKRDGFVARRLAKDTAGQWQDVVEWQTHDAAQAASQDMMKDPDMAGFLGAIKMDGVEMRHLDLRYTQDA